MNEYFSKPVDLLRMREGPLGFCIDAFSAFLHEQGFAITSARRQMRLVLEFSRWLHRNGYGVQDVSPDRADRFLKCRLRDFHPQSGDLAALRRLVGLLYRMGIIACPEPTRIETAYDGILDGYQAYLSHERALSAATLENYLPFARQLLSERFPGSEIEVSQLCAADITGFVQRHAQCLSRKRALLMTSALRSFLRFLYQRGDIRTQLAACVPTVPSWSLSDTPKYIQPSEVQRILDHCDRMTAVGRRDYAILLLLARLGLRAGEVAFLKLEDIDWQAGHITIQGKGGRSDVFPMEMEVGEAIVNYLQNGRPCCSSRRVFVRSTAPRTGFATHTAIGTIVKRALARAQINSPNKGAHLLRHTLATQMLQQGASLKEIGEILRHRHPNTTVMYAKVDLSGLRTIAPPWPGGAQ